MTDDEKEVLDWKDVPGEEYCVQFTILDDSGKLIQCFIGSHTSVESRKKAVQRFRQKHDELYKTAPCPLDTEFIDLPRVKVR